MNFSKIKRVLSAYAAAVMCAVTALSVPAAAKTDNTEWKNAKALTSSRYSETYIKLAEKYSEKETKNTVTFGKSRTKKLFDKMTKSVDSDNPKFTLNIVDDSTIGSVAVSGKKIKGVMYDKDYGSAFAFYINSKEISLLSVKLKLKAAAPISSDDGYDQARENALGSFSEAVHVLDGTDITDKTKGKRFKIRSGDKIYYYEEFIVDGSKCGILFDSKDAPLAMTSGKGSTYCFNFTDTVKASEFTLPKDYKDVTDENMDDFLDSLGI